jgi:ABC-type oligopeptide transport system substrate-binding subunit
VNPRPLVLVPAALLALAVGCASGRAPAGREPRVEYFGDVTPPAEDVFTFNLGAEPETFDPALATGEPDGRVCRILFEGLTADDPRGGPNLPGQAYRWEVSADGLTYTFHLRPGLAWSDGTPLTARDFAWSWLRVLRPERAARYAGVLQPILNAQAYNQGVIRDSALVGLRAPDDSTFVVRLARPTAYFLSLTSFNPFLPVPRHVVERWGDRWTHPGHIVSNGGFVLAFWRQNDHFEFRRNSRYRDAAGVRLDGIRAYTIDDLNTSVHLYKAGVIDWNPSGYMPSQHIPYVRRFADFRHGRYQGTYFYSFNVTRRPFDDVRVRRALALAVDREAIARDLLKGSRDAWGNLVPSGYPGYRAPAGMAFDPRKARATLAEAGYAGGKGFPRISILFNTSEDQRRIAEAVQAMWRRELGIEVELQNMEWGSAMQATASLHYDVARRSWIGDYLDPVSFLGCWLTGDGNNRTGWGDRRYDALLHAAAEELDPERRMRALAAAESLLLDQCPIVPIYHYATNELVKPYVRGIDRHPLDVHPLTRVWIDREWRRRPAEAAAGTRGARPPRGAAYSPSYSE